MVGLTYVGTICQEQSLRGALVNAATTTECGKAMISEFVVKEINCQVIVWFARIPTSSNIAYKPSRLDITELMLWAFRGFW